MSYNLPNCPFCNGNNFLKKDRPGVETYLFQCSGCGARVVWHNLRHPVIVLFAKDYKDNRASEKIAGYLTETDSFSEGKRKDIPLLPEPLAGFIVCSRAIAFGSNDNIVWQRIEGDITKQFRDIMLEVLQRPNVKPYIDPKFLKLFDIV